MGINRTLGLTKVAIADLLTGESGVVEVFNDYVLICAGSAVVTSITVHPNGTHQLTIKGVKRAERPAG